MNLSGFIKKVSFRACHLDKFYRAYASPIDTYQTLKNYYWLNSGAPNENIVQNHFNIALLNVF